MKKITVKLTKNAEYWLKQIQKENKDDGVRETVDEIVCRGIIRLMTI